MSVTVEHRTGIDLPEGLSQLCVKEVWIVAIGDELIAMFFNADEAYAYAKWLQQRLDEELKVSSESEPEPEPEPSTKKSRFRPS